MSMKLLIALCFYLLQPALWVGVIRTYLVHRNRVKRERQLFSSAIYEDFYEGRHFVRSGLILGVVVSIVFGGFLSVSVQWLFLYELLILVGLLIFPGQLFPVTTAGLVSVVTILVPHVPQLKPFVTWFNNIGLTALKVNPLNFLIILTLIIVGSCVFLHVNGGKFASPSLARNQRNNRVAVYKFNEMSIIPFLMLVPGNWFVSRFLFIPMFQINGHSYAVLIIPILLGLKLTVKRSVPRSFFIRLSKSLMVLSGLGIVLVGIGYVATKTILPGIFILILGYYLSIWLAKHEDNRQKFEYSEVMDGIRVIGIQLETPAAKMNLQVGDVILTVNEIPVANEDEFYRALSTNSTYCRFKVRDRNDQLKITETAIFKNSPHEIGVKTYTHPID